MAQALEIRILLVEDSPSDARLLQQSLKEVQGVLFTVTWAERLADAVKKLGEQTFDVGLIDLTLPDSSGVSTYQKILEAAPSLPVVVLTGAADETAGVEAIRRGVQDYLVKGAASGGTIARVIRYALERKQALANLHKLNTELEMRVSEIQAANKALADSRRAAINLMEDAILARNETQKASEDLRKLNRTLKALGRSSQAMLHVRNEPEYLREVCRIVVEDCGYSMVWIGFADTNEGKTVTPAAFAGFEEGYLQSLNVTWADSERGHGPTGTAIRTGKVSACRNMLTDPAFAPWREQAIQRGYSSSIAFPLMSPAQERALGAITIYSKEPNAFSDPEMALLSELANDLSHAITSLRIRAALDSATETLRKERNFSNAVIQTTGGLIAGFDPEGRIQIFNQACEKTTGYTFEEVRGRPFWDFLLVIEEKDQVREVFRGIVEGTVTAEAEFENYWVARDGERRFIRWANSALRDENGRVSLVLGTGIDITERQTIEEQLHLKAVELTNANQDLEAFAYSVSHDLRNPLHSMMGCIDVFRDYSPKLDRDFGTALGHVENSLHRMSDIISNLLVLSRVGRQEVRREPVDIGALALSVFNELRRETPDREVRFEGLPSLTLKADNGLARLLMENLMRNAWKFTSHKEDAVIEFGAQQKNGRSFLFVRDNGAGFDMAHAQKIFEPFVRLHSDKEFKGTGIGLAIVKRIVDKHGGTIWAEGEKDKGAVFYFALE
ncbi:MAG TPA: PAS domain S-box protein [Chitinivibrionales bacterium]|jgi:PAS domain S-box-containing protein|nr:PAS domain S-box protein [Chitinivibrionales bacterium]